MRDAVDAQDGTDFGVHSIGEIEGGQEVSNLPRAREPVVSVEICLRPFSGSGMAGIRRGRSISSFACRVARVSRKMRICNMGKTGTSGNDDIKDQWKSKGVGDEIGRAHV